MFGQNIKFLRFHHATGDFNSQQAPPVLPLSFLSHQKPKGEMLQALPRGIICCFYGSDATLTCSYGYNNCDNPLTAILRKSYDTKFTANQSQWHRVHVLDEPQKNPRTALQPWGKKNKVAKTCVQERYWSHMLARKRLVFYWMNNKRLRYKQ